MLSIEFPESSRHPSCDLVMAVAALSALVLAAVLRHLARGFHSRGRAAG